MKEDAQCAGRAIEAGHFESACSLWWRFEGEKEEEEEEEEEERGFLLVGRVRGTKNFFFPLSWGGRMPRLWDTYHST